MPKPTPLLLVLTALSLPAQQGRIHDADAHLLLLQPGAPRPAGQQLWDRIRSAAPALRLRCERSRRLDTLTPAQLAKYRILVYDGAIAELPEGAPRQALLAYLKAGRSLVHRGSAPTWLAAGAEVLAADLAAQLDRLRKLRSPAWRPDPVRDPEIPFLRAAEAMNRVHLPPQMELQLVAAEPQVEEPVAMDWDADGVLYVVELRGYMQDVDGTGEQRPVGRVVRLEDTDGDGRMDRQTVFLDELVEPRAILCLDRKILVAEPPLIWECEDRDGDGIADRKTQAFDGYGTRKQNVEHKDNALLWALDNWIYNAKSRQRFRYTAEGLERHDAAFRSQWGLTQDNLGRLYATSNSVPFEGEQLPREALQKGPKLGFNHRRYKGDFQAVYPIIGTPDVQSGPGILRKDRTLSRFTAICGQNIYRGDRLPEVFRGDLFIPEPVGRLIRRAEIVEEEGVRFLHNPAAATGREFCASTDSNFRPVNMYTGPDGCLYVIDMYRGIIQHGNWTRKGSYLRKEILRRGFEQHIGRGRIYRIVHQDFAPHPRPRLLDASPARLVATLGHANGWHRDAAQKLLVLRRDPAATAPLLRLLRDDPRPLARLHALWTLHGRGELSAAAVAASLADPSWRVRRAAAQLMPEFAADQAEILTAWSARARSEQHVQVLAMAALSLGTLEGDQARSLWQDIASRSGHLELVCYAALAGTKKRSAHLLMHLAASGALDRKKDARTRWLDKLCKVLLEVADPQQATHLLEGLPGLRPDLRQAVLGRLAKALPRGDGNQAIRLVRLKAVPANLSSYTRLDAKSARSWRKARLWFTWPGEARYHAKQAFLPPTEEQLALLREGGEIYGGLCAACHGLDGKGVQAGGLALAPDLRGNKRVGGHPDRPIQILLRGMRGPIGDQNYAAGLMAPMGNQSDRWIAAVLSHVRRNFGNHGTLITPEDVAEQRSRSAGHREPFTHAELTEAGEKQSWPPPPATAPAELIEGLDYAVVHGDFQRLPDFAPAAIKKRGSTKTLSLDVAGKEDEFGIRFTGFLRVEKPGQYLFVTRGDDGARLWLNETLVVDGDRGRAGRGFRAEGRARLQPGLYRLRLDFFEQRGGQVLTLAWKPPGQRQQPVPPGFLLREPAR